MPTTGSLRSDTLLEAAAAGRLPDWARAGQARRAHIARVADLMDRWAVALGLDERDRRRWRAAAWLHDVVRDAPASDLRPHAGAEFDSLPGKLLHGPAAAALLRKAGVDDDALLTAVAFHTLGDASFDMLGRALYAADFLEPGRSFNPGLRAVLRARMPDAIEDVVRIIVRSRIVHLMESGHGIHPRTIGFWNTLAAEQRAGAH
jgi:2-amino-4-hydroxy-6-hydroxymethyldihydropteridine diphosphokinase